MQIKEKIPVILYYDLKNVLWTDRKGVYEATFDMLENKLFGGMKK